MLKIKLLTALILFAVSVCVYCPGCSVPNDTGFESAATSDELPEGAFIAVDEETYQIGDTIKIDRSSVKLTDVITKEEPKQERNICTFVFDITNNESSARDYEIDISLYRTKDGELIENMEDTPVPHTGEDEDNIFIEAGKTAQVKVVTAPSINEKSFYAETMISFRNDETQKSSDLLTGYAVSIGEDKNKQQNAPDITGDGSEKIYYLGVGDTNEMPECNIKLSSITKKELSDSKSRYTFTFEITNKRSFAMCPDGIIRMVLWDDKGTSSLYNKNIFKPAGNSISDKNRVIQPGQTAVYEFYADGPTQYDETVNIDLSLLLHSNNGDLSGDTGFNAKLS